MNALKKLQSRLYSSKVYQDWKRRNKSVACVKCDSNDTLEIHHIIPTYDIFKHVLKFFDGDKKEAYNYVLEMHQSDSIDCATTCNKCHTGQHSKTSKLSSSEGTTYAADKWCVTPRILEFPFVQKKSPYGLGFITFQVLLAVGWYILNGYMKSRIIKLDIKNLGKIIGKKQPASWKKSFDRAFHNLTDLHVLSGHIFIDKNEIEIHINNDYLQKILDNPWFFSLYYVKSPNMLTLSLRWFLSTVKNNRKIYSIGMLKLISHLRIKDRPSRFAKRVVEAAKQIKWVSSVKIDGELLRFKLRSRPIPVFSLRDVIREQIENGR